MILPGPERRGEHLHAAQPAAEGHAGGADQGQAAREPVPHAGRRRPRLRPAPAGHHRVYGGYLVDIVDNYLFIMIINKRALTISEKLRDSIPC